MALSILDGNQSATTLSTILSSGQHITAHTVVSLGTQAITDMRGAVSGSVVSISNFPASQVISGTVTANPTGTQTIAGTVTVGNTVTISGTVNAGLASENDFVVIGEEIAQGINNQGTIPISGTVTVGNSVTIGSALNALNDYALNYNDPWPIKYANTHGGDPFPISGTVTIGSALPAGTNRIGVVTIGGGTVTIGAGTAQIGSVTVGNSVTIASLPALVAGTAQIGSVTASISNSVTIASLPAISGTVTANSSNGSLTTRFGSVTTANTAFATSAVTNANRKYLLIQNVTTASNVITVGVGFTPTTTQGIQLSSGAGLTFEGSYIPTGAVNLLSSVTASCFTILEA